MAITTSEKYVVFNAREKTEVKHMGKENVTKMPSPREQKSLGLGLLWLCVRGRIEKKFVSVLSESSFSPQYYCSPARGSASSEKKGRLTLSFTFALVWKKGNTMD